MLWKPETDYIASNSVYDLSLYGQCRMQRATTIICLSMDRIDLNRENRNKAPRRSVVACGVMGNLGESSSCSLSLSLSLSTC